MNFGANAFELNVFGKHFKVENGLQIEPVSKRSHVNPLSLYLFVDEHVVQIESDNAKFVALLASLHQLGEKGHHADVLDVWVSEVFCL